MSKNHCELRSKAKRATRGSHEAAINQVLRRSSWFYRESVQTLGLTFADVLFGPAYSIHFLVLLQELAWHISIIQVVDQGATMLENLEHLQTILIFACTQHQRHLADKVQLEVARLAIQRLGYDSWASHREDIPLKDTHFWGLLNTALRNAYIASALSEGPSGARFNGVDCQPQIQNDLAIAVSKALAACGYELCDGVIQKQGEPTFADFMCHKVCRVSTETSPELQTLIRKRRNDYNPIHYEARLSFYDDYWVALGLALGDWNLLIVERWERRIGLVGGDPVET